MSQCGLIEVDNVWMIVHTIDFCSAVWRYFAHDDRNNNQLQY